MAQPPDLRTVAYVLSRAEVLHGEEVAEQLGVWLTQDWSYAVEHQDSPADVAVWTATQQLLRAVRLRRAGHPGVANLVDHLAEACALSWTDELTITGTELPASP